MGIEKQPITLRMDEDDVELIRLVGSVCEPPSENRSRNFRTLRKGFCAFLITGRMPRWMGELQRVLRASCVTACTKDSAAPEPRRAGGAQKVISQHESPKRRELARLPLLTASAEMPTGAFQDSDSAASDVGRVAARPVTSAKRRPTKIRRAIREGIARVAVPRWTECQSRQPQPSTPVSPYRSSADRWAASVGTQAWGTSYGQFRISFASAQGVSL